MAKPALSDAVDLYLDRKWRLNNHYYIEDKHGQVVLFQMNAAQEKLLDEMHDLNIILKARQMGFSTFILILALDCCIFNSHFDAGLIADTLDNAKGLLKRIKFAYGRLPKEIKDLVQISTDNAQEIEFSNHSSVEVGVSLRSSTKNFLHISEYGKICAKQPDKAKEINSGALNTLAKGQLGFIESTAEGRGGDFYNKTEQSRKIKDSGREPVSMEWKFHFFPWFEDPAYTIDDAVALTAEEKKYFTGLRDEHGIELTEGQMSWYAVKSREQGEDMFKEYPSTPDEAFTAAKDGTYFAKQIRALRQRGKIGALEFEPRTQVNTFWDLGVSDSTTIWLHQLIAGKHRFVGYYENSGEGIDFYIDWLNKWRAQHSAAFGDHYAPHDVEHRKMGHQAKSIKTIAAEIGFKFEVVERTTDKLNSIQAVRTIFPECEFDESACDQGLVHLESYSREWDEKYGVWKSKPRHDDHSHCADAFMTFADGYKPPKDTTYKRPQIRRRTTPGGWM